MSAHFPLCVRGLCIIVYDLYCIFMLYVYMLIVELFLLVYINEPCDYPITCNEDIFKMVILYTNV